MSTYGYLEQVNKEQSVNAGYSTVSVSSAQTNPADNVIPMVSEDAIDTDMTDKVVTTTSAKPAKDDEKPGFLRRLWNNVADGADQLYKRGVIKVAELVDGEKILEYAHGFKDLCDENLERLADVDVKSELREFRQKAGEVTARMQDAEHQHTVAMRHTQHGDDDVRLGYARNLDRMQPENQAPVAGNVAQYSTSSAPTEEVVKRLPYCATEYQAETVNAVTKGVVDNQNYDTPTKIGFGVSVSQQIKYLDESQQADAYNHTANNMQHFNEVVESVANEVANFASDKVRKEALEKLQNSTYENLRKIFKNENIKKIQAAYKQAIGVAGKTVSSAEAFPVETQEKETEEVALQVVTPVEEVISQENVSVVEITIPEATEETYIIENTEENQSPLSEETKTETRERNYTHTTTASRAAAPVFSGGAVKTFKECRSIKDVEEVIKSAPKETVQKFYERLTKSQRLGLCKNTQLPEIQLAMLKQGIVKYEEVRSHLLPAVNSLLAVYSLNHEIDEAIQLA